MCDVLLCFVTFPCGGLGQVWCLIVKIPDLCLLFYLPVYKVYISAGCRGLVGSV